VQISHVVRIRRQRWRVVGTRTFDACALVTVAAVDPDAEPRIRRFLTPFDLVEPAIDRVAPVRVGLRRWRRACRDVLAGDAPPSSLRSAARAQIDLMPHQLEPALAILQGEGTRLLLADDVGLGKTIQAGLIVAELLERRAAERVLVVAPASLRDQWAGELRERFGLDVAVADAPTLRRLAAELPVGVNPWTTTPIAVASIDYVKRPEVLRAVRACSWDAVIVDEAHAAVGESERHAAVHELAAAAGYVLLLTATPHSGDRRAFAALCDVGAVDRDRLVVFRRTRAAIADRRARRVHVLRVRTSAAEARMQAALRTYTEAVRQEHGERCLALAVLHKRALSSAWALAQSVSRRLEALSATSADALQLRLPIDDPDGERTADDCAPEWPADLTLADAGRERRLLAAVLQSARAADRSDSKLNALGRLARRIREPMIVFTEYRDTLHRLAATIDRPSVRLHGGLGREERLAALREFARRPGAALLATDAAGQGLNLHHHCRLVISLELPWNPMRLEQRIGRVDRIGQQRCVHAIHVVGAATDEMRILQRLRSRLARAAADIGVPDPFGADDEQSVARDVILGVEPETGGELRGADALSSPSTAHYGSDAVVEACRLTHARELMNSSHAVSRADAPLLTRTRRSRTRAALNGRTLTVWRLAAEDGDGGTAEVRVTGALAPRGSAIEDVRTSVDAAAAEWRGAAIDAASRFWSARLDRERGIAARLQEPPPDLFQPGLFDRRADRARHDREALHEDLVDALRRRLTSLERRSRIAFRPPRLALVLVP
jgi:superfamily II DNA or RNA helicase